MTSLRRHSFFVAVTVAAVLASLAVAPASARPVDDSDSTLEAALSGVITGRVLIQPEMGAPVAVNAGSVSIYPQDSFPSGPIATAPIGALGTFTIGGLPAGTYDVAFVSTDTRFSPVRAWNGDRLFAFQGSAITLVDSAAFAFGDVVISERAILTTRASGPNRFATAVAISALNNPDGADRHVIIVNGLTFPDALSAGAFAGRELAPVLMVTGTTIPPETLAELDRLDPYAITIIGGTGVVSAGVQVQLEAFLPGPETVSRIAGPDRYATSRAVVELMNSQLSISTVLVATGRDYPDALAAVPAAGANNGAVLLVNGSASTLDTATRNLIDSLNLPVTIIGGTGSVSAGIASQISGLGVTVNRVQGASRYETALAIANELFVDREVVFLATGTSFADALAVGSRAASFGWPLLLSQPTCVPNVVYADIYDSLINEVDLVGGTGSLSAAVESLTPCSS